MRVIGVTPMIDDRSGRITINQDYLDGVSRAGAFPMLLSLNGDTKSSRAALERLDGLVLTGGADVGPENYGEEKLPCCGETAPMRDRAEFLFCRLALEMDLPILAICRGHQVLNCALGGALYQDIAAQFSAQIKHPCYDTPALQVHGATLTEGTLLRSISGRSALRVNSRHHQAIKRLGEGLIVNARAEDGLIEGVELPGKKFVLGVQWHPETLSAFAPEAQAIFQAFVNAGGEKA